jgi:hypothetical protein
MEYLVFSFLNKKYPSRFRNLKGICVFYLEILLNNTRTPLVSLSTGKQA